LPKDSKIVQRITYDNSADNPRNPNDPTVRVQYGLSTTDEIGLFWIQVLADVGESQQAAIRYFEKAVSLQPQNTAFRNELTRARSQR
jgi:hypothetical protein